MSIRACLVFLVLLSPLMAAAPVFSQMEDGDVVALHYLSSGCFHNEDVRFVFTRTAGQISVVAHQRKRADETEPRLIGRASLSAPQVQRLDIFLRHYRLGLTQDSTTSETVEVKYIEDGSVVATETFINARLPEESQALTMWELLRMLETRRND